MHLGIFTSDAVFHEGEPQQASYDIDIEEEYDEEFFAVLLGGEDGVLVGGVGGDESEVVVAEAFDLLNLGGVFLGVEVFGVVGDPLLAAAVEGFFAGVLDAVGDDGAVAVDLAEGVGGASRRSTGLRPGDVSLRCTTRHASAAAGCEATEAKNGKRDLEREAHYQPPRHGRQALGWAEGAGRRGIRLQEK